MLRMYPRGCPESHLLVVPAFVQQAVTQFFSHIYEYMQLLRSGRSTRSTTVSSGMRDLISQPSAWLGMDPGKQSSGPCAYGNRHSTKKSPHGLYRVLIARVTGHFVSSSRPFFGDLWSKSTPGAHTMAEFDDSELWMSGEEDDLDGEQDYGDGDAVFFQLDLGREGESGGMSQPRIFRGGC